MNRHDHTPADYSDYSLLYDKSYHLRRISVYVERIPRATRSIRRSTSIGTDQYRKMSHELRVATPKDQRLRFIGGLFYERQEHYILQNYLINELPTVNSVTGWPQTLWLTNQIRVDRDYAVFGELSFDFTPKPHRHRRLPLLPLRQLAGRLLRFGAEQPPRVAHRREGHDLPAGRHAQRGWHGLPQAWHSRRPVHRPRQLGQAATARHRSST